jgi:general secretion pathway protein A
MDRKPALTWQDLGRSRYVPGDDLVLPSRASALAALGAGLAAQSGPVLLTGEPGVGKTWLTRQLAARSPHGWSWVHVDLAPTTRAEMVDRLILEALGQPATCDGPVCRTLLDAVFNDAAADGEPVALVIEEAQFADPEAMEALRVLANRLDSGLGLAAMVLVGRTALARMIATRPFAAMRVRLVESVHLRALDVEEMLLFLRRIQPQRGWDADEVDRLHRAVHGNARQALILARRYSATERIRPASPPAEPAGPAPLEPRPQVVEPAASRPAWDGLALDGGKPPIEVGDEMIEVGWQAMSAEEPQAEAPDGIPVEEKSAALRSATTALAGGSGEEAVNDHYAALQAWTEWARSQGRESESVRADVAGAVREPGSLTANEPLPVPPPPNAAGASVWAEGQHDFAPYSQLFSRLRQSREP